MWEVRKEGRREEKGKIIEREETQWKIKEWDTNEGI